MKLSFSLWNVSSDDKKDFNSINVLIKKALIKVMPTKYL